MHLGDMLALCATLHLIAEGRLVAQRVRAIILRRQSPHQPNTVALGSRAQRTRDTHVTAPHKMV